MVAAKTTDDLIAAVNARCLLPTADGRLTTAEKLEFATQRVASTLAELVVGSRSQRWVQAGSDTSIVSGTYVYDVPERALAAGVAIIVYVSGTAEVPMVELSFEEAAYHRQSRGPWEAQYAYTWLDDKIELLPHPVSTGGSLRIYYPRAVPKLVPTTSCAIVTGSTGSTITATSAQSILGSTVTVDVVKGTPNGNPRGLDLSATCVSNTITVATPTGTAAGDYVCIAGQTCVPQIPQSLWQVLVLGTSYDVQDALGDSEARDSIGAALMMAIRDAKDLLSPRSRGAHQRVKNRHSPLRERR